MCINCFILQARKALCALRGLVKLQALVRGHQVRKQTAATLQRMHTLMTIQARTRCQRAQMARESQISVKSRSSRHRVSSPFLSAVLYKSQIIMLMLTELRAMENSLILKLAYNTLLYHQG
jgi:hypothetical protein